jgi:hypothetical protein
MMSAEHDLGSRRGWGWLVVLLVVLGGVETIVVTLITHQLLPMKAALVVDAIVVNWTVVAMYAFASPMWGRVEMRGDSLVVRFGLVGSLRVPIQAILDAAPHQAPAMTPLQLGGGFDEASGRMSLVRSTTSESVIVTFRIPVAGRVQLLRPVLARSLVLTTSGAAALADDINARVLDATGGE